VIDFEPFLDAAIATLKAQLPAALAEINLEHTGDLFTVPFPDADTGYILGGRPIIAVPLPIVQVAATDFELGEASVEQLSYALDLKMTVQATLAHVEADILYRTVMRFGSAIVDVMCEPDAFGGGTVAESVTGAYRVAPDLNESMEIVAATSIEFQLGGVEQRRFFS
jgi:hypothetical protein